MHSGCMLQDCEWKLSTSQRAPHWPFDHEAPAVRIALHRPALLHMLQRTIYVLLPCIEVDEQCGNR
jgi:hypothetical protein